MDQALCTEFESLKRLEIEVEVKCEHDSLIFCQDLFLLHLHIKDSVLMIKYTTILYYKHKFIVSEKDLLTVDLYAHAQ